MITLTVTKAELKILFQGLELLAKAYALVGWSIPNALHSLLLRVEEKISAYDI